MPPDVHAQAVLNLKMCGGPFMDLNCKGVEDVKVLREETLQKQKLLLDFAKAIGVLDNLLATEAQVFGLEALYEKVPEVH